MTPDESASTLTVEQIFSADPPAQASDEGGQQPRDEQGRFATKTEEVPAQQPAPAAQEQPQQQPTVEQPRSDAAIPPGRLREEADARRAAEANVERLTQLVERMARGQQQPQREQRPPPKPIDIVEDPQGYAKALEDRIFQHFAAQNLNASLEAAHEEHGERFEKAYEALLREVDAGDVALRHRIVNASNPGRSLMRWHMEREAIREIGGDLGGYRKKLLTDEAFRKDALGDQAFVDFVLSQADVRKRAAELWRNEAQSSPASANVTTLPNLSRAPAARTPAETGLGGSDQERFDSVFARR